MPAKATRQTFDDLDLLRGLAAIVVVLHHIPEKTINDLIPSPDLAVDFFFMLSGFVLTHAHFREIREGTLGLGFMIRRIVRIYPFYILATALNTAIILYVTHQPGERSVDSLLVWNAAFSTFVIPTPPALSYAPKDLFPLLFPAWSLFFELVANAILMLLVRSGRSRAALVAALVVAASFIPLIWTTLDRGRVSDGFSWATFEIGFIRVAFSFFLGVTIYHLKDRLPSRLSCSTWLAATTLLLTMCGGLWIPRALNDLVAVIAIYPALILLSANRGRSDIPRVARFLGATSFGVYAMHVPLYGLFEGAVWLVTGAEWASIGIGATLVFVPLMLGIVALLDRRFDMPVRKALLRRIGVGKPARA